MSRVNIHTSRFVNQLIPYLSQCEVFRIVSCTATESPHHILITCPYHLSLPLLMTVVIGSTLTSLLNSSRVLLSFMEIPHMHLISVSLLFQTLIQHQLIHYAASDTTSIHSTFHLQWGSSGYQKCQKLSELHPSISDSSCSSKIHSTISLRVSPG